MVIDEQDDVDPDVLPSDLFEDEIEDDWFDINTVVDIHIYKDEY